MQKITTGCLILAGTLCLSACTGGSPIESASEDTRDTVSAGVQAQAEEEITSVETEDAPVLPEADYEDYRFTIAFRDHDTHHNWIADLAFDEDALADVVEEAKYKRNMAIEERFHVIINPVELSGDIYGNTAVQSILADSAAYDLIAPHAHITWNYYIAAGYTLNWTDHLPYCNFDKPWWDQDSRESLSIGGKIYTMAGDYSYYSFAYSKALVFNKQFLADLGEPAPYETVLQGKWTVDAWNRLLTLAVTDTNHTADIDLQNDTFGYVTNIYGGPVDVFFACDARIIRKDTDDMPYITLGDEKSLNVFDWYFQMMEQKGRYTSEEGSTQHLDIFRRGNALFTDVHFLTMNVLRDMDDDWGVLPLPKWDEAQSSYRSNVDAGVHLFVLPKDNRDTERTSVLLEAMSYEGSRLVIPAFYEIAMQNKYARDPYSTDMMEIIKNSRVFDFGYFTCFHSIGSACYNIAKMSNPNPANYIKQNQKAAERSLQKFIAKIETIE